MPRVNYSGALLDSPWLLVIVLALIIVIAVAVFRIVR
jgi:hypothetical protein